MEECRLIPLCKWKGIDYLFGRDGVNKRKARKPKWKGAFIVHV